MVPSQWGMHFYASRDYMHLGTIFLYILSGERLCLFSPSCQGDMLSDYPSEGYVSRHSFFRGDMVPPQWGMHLYASWDYMHLKAISPCIPLGGYISKHPFFKGDMAPFYGVCIYLQLGTICISGLYLRSSPQGTWIPF